MNKSTIPTISILVFFIFICATPTICSQAQIAKENMPSGTIQEYKWWNLLQYTIDIIPDYTRKFIRGTNEIHFVALQAGRVLQIDLQQPMLITDIIWNNKSIKFKRDETAYFVTFPESIQKGKTETITVHFEGHPHEAVKPPWGESGWIWASDKKGRPWMSISCEGSGASIWLPCKEVLYDEPDKGILFSITVPDTLAAVANGRLQKVTNNQNRTFTYTWSVINPINDYNICSYIGKYVTWHQNYAGLKGNLDCDFWALDYNEQKARNHLKEVDTMLNCFEECLGPYPFYEDSYKVVEAPFVGMEHQSAIAYGNGFEQGYGGKNLSGTEWGLKWDFILIHESGHEWFGNSITANTGGESWIHESFTKYLETIYTDYVYGNEAGNDYTIGIWKRILNDKPVLSDGTSDTYNKGSAMLHMIRQIIGDTSFKSLLRGLNKTFYHHTVNTNQILYYINHYSKHNFTKLFDQYLRTIKVPELVYFFQKNAFYYRWSNCVDNFNMPVKISFGLKKYQFIYPTTRWKKLPISDTTLKSITVDRNFYIRVQEQHFNN